MATNKVARNPKNKKNKNVSLQTKEQIITQYLRTQLMESIVTTEYVEKYAETQGKIIRETNKLFHNGKYRFGLESGVLIPMKIDNVLSYREFWSIETRYLKMRARVQDELAQIYQSDGEPFIDVVVGDICAIHWLNVWYRGEVIRIIPNVDPDKTRYSVRLLDFGRVVRTNEHRLRLLKGWLVQLSALAVACTLTELNEDEEDILMDESLAGKLFNQLKYVAANSEQVLIHLVSTNEHPGYGYINEVHLFADCKTDTTVSNAAYLIHETFGAFNPMQIEFREPICTEWLQKHFKDHSPKQKSQFNRKYAVTMRHIAMPSYFYVQMQSQTELLQKIRKQIENYVSSVKDTKAAKRTTKWRIGQSCLCLDDSVWYRGRISKLLSPKKYMIFLCDNGRQITVTKYYMLRMPTKLSEQPDCVLKCHLDVSTEWLNENADDFRKFLKMYKSFAVSTCTTFDRVPKQSIGVTLFGTNSEPYLENDQAWENIGTRIISQSIMTSLEYFITKTQYYYRIQKYQPDYDVDSNHSFDHVLILRKAMAAIKSCETLDIQQQQQQQQQQKTRTKLWDAAIPLTGTTFMASIGHISDEGVFFIHSDADMHLVCEINRTIDAIVDKRKDQNDNKAGKWTVGMACFAKSEHNDFPNEYYRATIKSIDHIEQDCVVEFVDYGNYGCSKLCELHVATHFADIPSLAHPYYLRNVIAASEFGKWNPDIVGPCRKQLVGKIFAVFVEHEDDNQKPIVPCEMQFIDENNINLFDWLIAKQLHNGTQLDNDDQLIVNV